MSKGKEYKELPEATPLMEEGAEQINSSLVTIRNRTDYPIYINLEDGTSLHLLPRVNVEITDTQLNQASVQYEIQLNHVIIVRVN
jgi:hypothetical protein